MSGRSAASGNLILITFEGIITESMRNRHTAAWRAMGLLSGGREYWRGLLVKQKGGGTKGGGAPRRKEAERTPVQVQCQGSSTSRVVQGYARPLELPPVPTLFQVCR